MKKKFFKSKTQMIIYMFLFTICISLFIIIGRIDFQKDIDTESKKFSSLYDLVPDNNLYNFSDANDILEIVNGKSGVILMGNPTNKWTNYIAKILNEVGIELEIDKIYYYDFFQDRKESNGTYETIVNKLKIYVPTNDLGIQNIQAPTVVVVKNGEILGYFDETSIIKGTTTPEVYFNNYQINLLYEEFKEALNSYK